MRAISRGGSSISSNIHVTVGPGALSVEEAMGSVTDPRAGGTAVFVGTVRSPNEGREVQHLDYDVWPERVEQELNDLGAEALDRFAATRVWIAHRTGRVHVGEASVVVAVSAPHRAAAFDACRWTIDALKQRAPIWKREVAEDGATWVANA